MFGDIENSKESSEIQDRPSETKEVSEDSEKVYDDIFSDDYINVNPEIGDKPEVKVTDTTRNPIESPEVIYMNMFSDNYDNQNSVNTEQSESKTENKSETENGTHEPNSKYKDADGNEYETDDNGNTYKKNGELLPNAEYTVNGYHYKTDDQGRIVLAEGKLRLTDRDNRKTINEDMSNIGKGDERETDERGHLIGDQFDGINKLENLVPMDAHLNKGDFKALEKKLADAVRDGKDVTVTIEPVYDSDSKRPTSFIVTYTIDGEETVVVFENGGDDNNE